MVFPNLPFVVFKPLFLLRKPVGLVGACLRNEIYLESSLLEDVERVKGFGDEKPGSFPSGYSGACAEVTAISALRGGAMWKADLMNVGVR